MFAVFLATALLWIAPLGQAADAKDHWAFQPVKRPAVNGPDHPIDALVLAKLRDKGLTSSSAADRQTLIRRLYLVMHGLPPKPEEVSAFVADPDPAAFAKLIEKVLTSERYGERWASHWLDLVRFGETTGFETNRERPNAWHYRDWVIDSLNSDKPYDQFVREQLAGDALGAGVGTGFLVAGPNDIVKGQDPKLGKMQRMNELDDMINATGTTFLGLTTGCARCHDHKFDPISQKDYYSMQAVFAGVSHGDRSLPSSAETEREIDSAKDKISTLKLGLAEFLPKQEKAMREPVSISQNVERFEPVEARFVRFTIEQSSSAEPCIDELEIFSGDENVALASGGALASSSGDYIHPLHKLAHINDGRYGNSGSWIAAANTGWVQIEFPEQKRIDRIEWARDREGQFSDRLAIRYRIEAAQKAGEWVEVANSKNRRPVKGITPQPPAYEFAKHPPAEAKRGQAMLAELKKTEQRLAKLQKQNKVYAGNFSQPGATHLLYRGDPDTKREEVGPGTITTFASLNLKRSAPEQKRRLAMADWIADRENPLTARVLVNRLWQFHFGAGIVDTPSDFGLNGARPTHPELLDWLASEFMKNQWSMKHIHRMILNSKTWQQSSRPSARAMKVDAAGRLLWRYPTRRLAAEAIRDTMLAVSGVLDLKTGGPGFDGFEVQMENVRHFFPKKNYGPADWRRMVFMTKVRQERESVFGVFDCPDASQAVAKRSRSTTPLQALNLFNSRFVLQQAGLLAKRLQTETGSDAASQVVRAYVLCFNRIPSEEEKEAAIDFIKIEGPESFARALINANEFVFVP